MRLGALAVLLIALLAKTRSFYIAGLVPLFPTFAIIAHYIVGSERLASDLRSTAIFGLWSLLPYAAYLFTIVLLSERFTLVVTLTVGALAWAMAAGLLTVWTRTYPAVWNWCQRSSNRWTSLWRCRAQPARAPACPTPAVQTSSRNVTGPSLTRCTCISAPKRPVATCGCCARA